MTRRLVSIKKLEQMTGTHRNRLHDYIREERFEPEFKADTGHVYWTQATAERIAQVLKEEKATLQKGRGRKIEFSRLKHRQKKPEEPEE
jgi:hypothetical protein